MDAILNRSRLGFEPQGGMPSSAREPSPGPREWTALLFQQSLNPAQSDPAAEASLEAFSDLQQGLESFWGTESYYKLRALAKEHNSKIYLEALLGLRRDLVRSKRAAAAQLLFDFLTQLGEGRFAGIAARARAEQDAMSGRGPYGLEFLMRRCVQGTASPAALAGMAGMAVGGTVFGAARAVFLPRLLTWSASGLLPGGLGVRALASAGAVLLEAPSFVAVTQGARWALGESGGDAVSFVRESAGAYLMLNGLKLFGAAGEVLTLAGSNSRLIRALVPQFSTYAGILVGHGLEQAAGLRPAQPGENLFLDSFATLVESHFGGRLSEDLTPGLVRWQGELRLRGDLLAASRQKLLSPSGPSLVTEGSEALAVSASGNSSIGAISMMVRRPEDSNRSGETISEMSSSGTMSWRRDLIAGIAKRPREVPQTPQKPPAKQTEDWKRLFEETAVLQRIRRLGVEYSPKRMLLVLNRVRSILEGQMRKTYALETVVRALLDGGKLPEQEFDQYLEVATSSELFFRTPRLRNFSFTEGENPYAFVERLRGVRSQLLQRRCSSYSLLDLVNALRWHPQFPTPRIRGFRWIVETVDFVEQNKVAQLLLDGQFLEALTMEEVFLRLLRLKPSLLDKNGDPHAISYSLTGLRGQGLTKLQGGEINDDVISQARILDLAFSRWREWGTHFKNLANIEKWQVGRGSLAGWSRAQYAKQHLLKKDGTFYEDSPLRDLMYWGEFLGEHREALNLSEP